MVGPSKILTVSYGTFSCTLEGFDDSFATMKAIAEYFRDLAADDRYFGAEPPTPDAEMLARIAEREVARRVEARMDATGITLRTGTALDTPAAAPAMPPAPRAVEEAAPAPVQQPAPAPVAMPRAFERPATADFSATPPATAVPGAHVAGSEFEDDSADHASLLAASGPAAWSETAAPAPTRLPAHPDADSVAAKLQRIRAVVGQGAAGFAADPAEDALADDLAARFADEADEDNDALHDALAVAGDDMPEDADSAEQDLAADDDMPADAAAADMVEDEAEDLADDLADDMADDLAEEPAEETAAEEPDLAALMAVATAEDDAADDIEDDAEAPAETQAETRVAEAAEEDAEDEPVADLTDEAAEAAAAPVRARVIRMKRAAFDQAVAQGTLSEAAEDTFAALSPEEEEELMAELAAVERDAALETGDIAADTVPDLATDLDDFDLGDDDDDLAETADDRLTDAADDDASFEDADAEVAEDATDDAITAFTQQAKADADADLWEDEDEDEDTAAADLSENDDEDDEEAEQTAQRRQRPGRAMLDREPEADEEAMSRILSQTDAELNEPEGSRRRQAIAQLKAAVAATEAARRLGEPTERATTTEEAFRDDLDQAVNPRGALRPARELLSRTEPRSERPRPAPLKLVASQRIDLPKTDTAAAAASPVRPRRVLVDAAETAAPHEGEGDGFAAFAQSVGATELADLLEAAAAYTSFVEGLDDFSRPQIMTRVRQFAPEEFSREDGLRTFGTLLREGRISKVRNGRFQIADDTRFRPEPRVARG